MDVTDITESIKNTNRYNFHSHTEFCDGHAPMATMRKPQPAMASKSGGSPRIPPFVSTPPAT